MVPTAWITMEAFPLTPNRKVDRKALPPPEGSGIAPGAEYVAPRTSYEEALTGIWAEVLGLERVGTADNFFELGGHSLLATQIIARVRDHFEMQLPLLRLFQRPTIASLAELIETICIADQDSPAHRETTASELEEGEL
jgi:acyl carrier protein